VSAYLDWVSLAHIESGPAFRRIDRWGHVGDDGLHPNSLIPLLRSIFSKAGVDDADEYSGHSCVVVLQLGAPTAGIPNP
jgi:hypothetical protein